MALSFPIPMSFNRIPMPAKHLFPSPLFSHADITILFHSQAYRMVHQPVSRGFAVFADAWLSGWLAEMSADLREAVAH